MDLGVVVLYFPTYNRILKYAFKLQLQSVNITREVCLNEAYHQCFIGTYLFEVSFYVIDLTHR